MAIRLNKLTLDMRFGSWALNQKANDSYEVILNDSGHPQGRSEVVRDVDFYNAWADYQRFLSIADNPFT
ncbi:MAG TPA: hypothetical protein V6C57_07185 [Coleofasciculaceae cyanobacterium]